MAKRTTEEERRAFYALHQEKYTYAEIGQQYGVSRECVRYWCRRQKQGCDCVTRSGKRPGRRRRALERFERDVRCWILCERRRYPGRGPRSILHALGKKPELAGRRRPSEASIGRFLHQWAAFRRAPRRKTVVRERPVQPKQAFECWQVDFKMGIKLGNGTQVNLHTVREPVAGACLMLRVTPAGRQGHKPWRVVLAEVQETIRQACILFGPPAAIQTDGEGVFAGNPAEDSPSYFTLWLCGLHIEHRIIRPARPTDNAEVERCNGAVYNYAIRGSLAPDLHTLQERLDCALYDLLFELPSQAIDCKGRPPAAAHPELLTNPRTYRRQEELKSFDQKAVDASLATCTWRRRVSLSGQVCFGGHHMYYSVGKAHARRHVLIRFDPKDRCLVFYADQPKRTEPLQELARHPALGFSPGELTSLAQPSPAMQQRLSRSQRKKG
jgi:transposase InsO family protein